MVVKMLYESGETLYDFSYQRKSTSAVDFIRFEYLSGKGFCGFNNIFLAYDDDMPVGTIGVYDRKKYERLSKETLSNIFTFFGFIAGIKILTKSRHISSILSAPDIGEVHISHLSVLPKARRRGIAEFLITAQLAEVIKQGYSRCSLVVDEASSPAKSLYSKLSFKVTEKMHFLKGDLYERCFEKMTLSLNPELLSAVRVVLPDKTSSGN
ncbi:MAG: GNAT family N-acetyltransferase [Pseudomonadota bacterium]